MMGMKNEHKTGRPDRANLIRKSVRARSTVAILLHIQVPAWRLRDRNQVIELSDFWNAQLARAIHLLMFNDLSGSELVDILHELVDSLPGLRQYVGQRTGRSWRYLGDDAVNIRRIPEIRLRTLTEWRC